MLVGNEFQDALSSSRVLITSFGYCFGGDTLMDINRKVGPCLVKVAATVFDILELLLLLSLEACYMIYY